MKIAMEFKRAYEYIKWILGNAKGFRKSIAFIIILDAATALVGVAVAILSKNLIDCAVDGTIGKAVVFASMFGTLVFANLGIKAFSSVLSVKTYELMSNSIRKRIFSRISISEWLYVTKYHSGDVLTRLTSDVGNVTTGVVNTLPSIIHLCVQLTAAFGTLLYYEPMLAVLAFILGPFTVLLSRIWGRKLKQLNVKVQESESAYRAFIQESIENMLIVKTFQLEKRNIDIISDLHGTRLKWVMKKNVTSVVASTTLGLGYWIGYLLAFCWGTLKLSRGTTSFGTLTAFLQLVSQVQGPFIGLASTIPQLISAIASSERLMELEALPVEQFSKELPAEAVTGISFKDIYFSYEDKKPILENLTVNIKPGEVVGIIGSSGEGKTTLIRLLLALVKPDEGIVSFVSKEGKEFLASAETRDWISYVPQGNTLFSGTIEENIRAGYSAASMEEIQAAARAACAMDFIDELADGMKSKVGERGVGLSEGQAQRISIARALLRKSPILILDEATSSLDIASEMHVLKSIHELKPARTCIVITHRPTALKICSRVLKLENGRLIEKILDDAEYDEIYHGSSESA
ncbi:ABC transporter ATP-binding protein [Ruminiclostridium herbifermentans]|uniref:ABC transporter ATP-binding protein n=1 Tax=Ruminiclostridium herbifermentans TaxID=2488810 RepID=A0A4U7JFX3_9FIRM|nr:ABC transporter ATP-binding protein [Ruminiclostridium herbifermentans]QNU68930.1 ABC transporter ATP-binding protein [Ruminiclostridium herbifermentans]